jgi:hypothetical protein
MSAVPALSAIASRQPCASKSAWAGFVVVSALLVAGSVYRAATYPLVHDEALSFAIFTWEPQWAGTANHHRLNTWAMEASARWFGVSELTLRLPNVLAHVVYLGCVLALLRRLGSVAVQVCAFAAWALNPFVLDFFALARGYGLGLAAMAASLALLARGAWLGALATAAVAVLAHFSFFLFYVALHPVVALWGWRQERSARAMLAAGGLSAAFAGWIVTRVGALQARHELYFGGTQGFLADTVGRLIECTLYAVAYPEALRTVAPFAVVGVLAGVVGVGMWVAIRRRDPVVVAMGALLAGMVALPIAARACGASLFPIERAALGYVPVAAAALAFALAAIVQRWPERGLRGAVLALGALGAAHFAAAYDVFSCRTWAAAPRGR